MSIRQKRNERRVAALLVICVAIVAFWEVMSRWSRRPLQPFELTAADFEDFHPALDAWDIQSLPVSPDPVEPNILIYRLLPKEPGAFARVAALPAPLSPLLVRLVHGYNMPDCMRIKHCTIELVADTRREMGTSARDKRDPSFPYQLWRLTSASADVSIWQTGMLRAGDFSATDVDTRAMAFPRIGIPDNPGWFPRGLSWRSLRHPVRNLRLFMRAKWNASRADWLTFLGLRRPAWASGDMLTLVTLSAAPSVQPEDEAAVTRQVMAAHALMYEQLRAWRLGKVGGDGQTQ